MIESKTFNAAIKEATTTLKYLAGSGYKGFDCSKETLDTLKRWDENNRSSSQTLELISVDLRGCRRCDLSKRRNSIVVGEGDPDANLVFIGEGPGDDEDRQGRPFVGPAGKLLTKIIQAMGLTRESVYICNIIKCRPPGNRNPTPDEIKSCLPFLNRQITAIKPDYICALGSVAARTLLKTDDTISNIRGKFQDYNGIRVMPTFHPAYLLRNSGKKREVWDDMQILMKKLGL